MKEVPKSTQKRYTDQGYCPWPRRMITGKSSHYLYKTWEMMKIRCSNPKAKGYQNYGGRGIKVCPEWYNSFDKFLEDMGDKTDPTFTLDRIDPDGNYEKSNCRWVSIQQQNSNKRVDYKSQVRTEKDRTGFVVYKNNKKFRFRTKEEAEAFLGNW